MGTEQNGERKFVRRKTVNAKRRPKRSPPKQPKVSFKKADLPAKRAFAEILRKRGYSQVTIAAKPADLIAFRGRKVHYFELKFTAQKDRYFGAATLTEWRAAIKKARYAFVVALRDGRSWRFEEYTPKEFMKFSYIPPFKIFFNLGVRTRDMGTRASRRALALTPKRLKLLIDFYDSLRLTQELASSGKNFSLSTTPRRSL